MGPFPFTEGHSAFSSVQFSHSVVSDSLRPQGPRHTGLPCPSPTPGAYSNSCLLRWWPYPTISSSVVPFSSCLQSFPASGFFPMNQFFTSGSQSTGASASASVLPMTIQGWFPLELTMLRSRSLSVIYFIYSSVCMLIQISQFISPSHSYPCS